MSAFVPKADITSSRRKSTTDSGRHHGERPVQRRGSNRRASLYSAGPGELNSAAWGSQCLGLMNAEPGNDDYAVASSGSGERL
jgi:hypothetical protein